MTPNVTHPGPPPLGRLSFPLDSRPRLGSLRAPYGLSELEDKTQPLLPSFDLYFPVSLPHVSGERLFRLVWS